MVHRSRAQIDIFADRCAMIRYPTNMLRQSFTNGPHSLQPLLQGRAHIAVGFVDLHVLAYHPLLEKPASGTLDKAPLVFLGVDDNPFHVAKSTVIWEMAGDTTVQPRHIVQAWYSSVWESHTTNAFRKAAATAVVKHNTTLTTAVHAYLAHWSSESNPPPSLPATRLMWAKAAPDCVGLHAVNFKRLKDRVQVGSHFLTGDLGLQSQLADDMVGSLAMWVVPDGSPPLKQDEYALSALPTHLLENLLRGDRGMFVMDAAETVAAQGAERLIRLSRVGRCIVDIR